jgi:competence protein ComEA
VPAVEGAGDGGPDAGGGGEQVVDLNTATTADLEGLPGVGPATARAILDYRQRHGRFRSVDELLEVRGIGPAKLAELRPRVRV